MWVFGVPALIFSLKPYRLYTTTEDDSDSDDEDELERYLLHVKPVPASACPNPIRWWLDRVADYPNLSKMALNYLIIPGVFFKYFYMLTASLSHSTSLATSVEAERAFSACTLALGKLRTHLSDDTFRAGLLLRSWHRAGLLPELGALTQCLKDQDSAERRKRKRGSEVGERDDASTSTKKAKTTSVLPNNVVTVVG
jgi:hypothetical protein